MVPLVLSIGWALLLAQASPPRETGCGFVAQIDGKPQSLGPFRDLRVLGGPEKVPIVVQPGGKLLAVTCDRSSVVPTVQDFRVLDQLGVPLYLETSDTVVRLQRAGAEFTVTAVEGRWSEAEELDIRKVLEAARTTYPHPSGDNVR